LKTIAPFGHFSCIEGSGRAIPIVIFEIAAGLKVARWEPRTAHIKTVIVQEPHDLLFQLLTDRENH
jgi:hypothetical protein